MASTDLLKYVAATLLSQGPLTHRVLAQVLLSKGGSAGELPGMALIAFASGQANVVAETAIRMTGLLVVEQSRARRLQKQLTVEARRLDGVERQLRDREVALAKREQLLSDQQQRLEKEKDLLRKAAHRPQEQTNLPSRKPSQSLPDQTRESH